MVEGFLREGAARPMAGPAPKAIIAPHAGLRLLGIDRRQRLPRRRRRRRARSSGWCCVGPSHFVPIRGLALPGDPWFATPLGEVAVEPAGAQASLRLPQVRLIPEAHAREHSLEVEIPFLQALLGEFSLVPLVVGDAPARRWPRCWTASGAGRRR